MRIFSAVTLPGLLRKMHQSVELFSLTSSQVQLKFLTCTHLRVMHCICILVPLNMMARVQNPMLLIIFLSFFGGVAIVGLLRLSPAVWQLRCRFSLQHCSMSDKEVLTRRNGSRAMTNLNLQLYYAMEGVCCCIVDTSNWGETSCYVMHGERQLKRRSKGLSSWTDVNESQFNALYTYILCTLASVNVHVTLECNAFTMAG